MIKKVLLYLVFLVACILVIPVSFILFSVCYGQVHWVVPLLIILALCALAMVSKQYFLLLIMLLMLATISTFYYFEGQWRKQNIFPARTVATLQRNEIFIADSNGIYIGNTDSLANVNRYGFRTRDFDKPECEPGSKKVMFLGDSFTWGAAADPLDSSYVDLVDDAGYCTFNTGIGGTDPVQYELVAKKYLPLIQPDIVLLMFYVGNDIMDCERVILPRHPVFYSTKGGLLVFSYKLGTCPQEPFDSFDEALEYYFSTQYQFPRNSIAGYTAIGTKIFSPEPPLYEITVGQPPGYVVTDKYLSGIQQICDTFNIPLWIYLIPDKHNIITSVDTVKKRIFGVFKEYENEHIYCPQTITLDDYEKYDGHLNNQGHRKYADDIVQRLNDYFRR